MKKGTVLTDAGRRQYAESYENHYTSKDLYSTFQFYDDIKVSYPDSEEVEYSRSQIQNIIRDEYPGDVLYGALLELGIE